MCATVTEPDVRFLLSAQLSKFLEPSASVSPFAMVIITMLIFKLLSRR